MSQPYTPSYSRAAGERRSDEDGAAATRGFEPRRYERELHAIFDELAGLERVEPAALDRILRRNPKDGRGLFSKAELIQGFRRLRARGGAAEDVQAFVDRIALRPVRTQSGVAPVSVLTKPHVCHGACIFCPNDARMPKSYLADEPGAQRAAQNGFDAYRQTLSRLAALRAIGHRTDKVELLILGGTWSHYPEAYRRWFALRCFEAMNDFGAGRDRRREAAAFASERTSVKELAAAQRRNESGACRCVGLVVETRPDCVSEAELYRIRRLGGTKVQIGVQSLSDAVLAANRRGHDVAATRRAMRLLRAAGFKVLAHWMPNLRGSTPERDVEDFERLFGDPDFRPDELKIYPCSLVESAELMAHYRRGEWRPYTRDELLFVLVECLRRAPRYCRLSRVIRDIPSPDIVVGNKETNFREVAEAHLRAAGGRSRDIRSREIRGERVDPPALSLAAVDYDTASTREVFLEFATREDRLAGFLRLSLPREPSFVAELAQSALIRELHVYGVARSLGERPDGRAQHAGLGRRLVAEARRRATAAGFADLAVISAVGTRAYYRRLGFEDGALYQHLALGDSS